MVYNIYIYISILLQALALNQDEPEWSAETDDTMRPDSELLERCHADLAQFKALAGLSDDMLHVPKVSICICSFIMYRITAVYYRI